MKNRILSLSILAVSLLVGTKASAFVGGPFDNGDYSILLERGGVYQATFSFSNGSGMALFNENNSFEVATGTTVTGMFSINNRSVFYYKGVTYFGTATGIVDVDARRVTGFTNGSSDYTTTTPVNAVPQAGTASARPVNIGYNGNVGFVANSTFTAKITSTAPILRFRGNGTVSFMGFPELTNMRTTVTNLVTQANTNTVVPINGTDTSVLPVAPATTVAATFSTAADIATGAATANQLLNSVANLQSQIDNPSTLENYQETHRMRVYGSRRFF